MFDNLREQANSSPFYEEEAQFQPAATTAPAPSASGRLLGTTPMQRLLLSVILFAGVCLVGAVFLVVTGKFGLF